MKFVRTVGMPSVGCLGWLNLMPDICFRSDRPVREEEYPQSHLLYTRIEVSVIESRR